MKESQPVITTLRQGNLAVALTKDAFAYNDRLFTLEVSEMQGDEYQGNDIGISGLEVTATAQEISVYLGAALGMALKRAGVELNVHGTAVPAAAAGMQAVQALRAVLHPLAVSASAIPDWTAAPRFCPYCGSPEIREVAEWEATSAEDPDNVANVKEYQCHGPCQGRSFWS